MPKSKLLTNSFMALVVAHILWGINQPILKLGLQTVYLPVFLSITLLGSSLLILPLALKNWKPMRPKDNALLVIGSVISITLGNVALLMGLERVPVVNASLIGLFGPLILFILSVEFLKERMSLRTFVGIMVAFAGAVVLISKPWGASGAEGQELLIGNMLLILSRLCDVIGILIMKPILKRNGTYQVTFLHLLYGILPIAIYSLWHVSALDPEIVGQKGYAAIALNIVLITAANCLFMYGLKRKKAQEVGIFSYLNPLTAFVAAWILLGESPTAKLGIGAALIFTGIYLAEIKPRRKSKAYPAK